MRSIYSACQISRKKEQIDKNFTKLYVQTVDTSCMKAGPSQVGGWGALAPQFLAKQLTLSQPGGQIMPTTEIQAPPDFQTLRRPWNMCWLECRKRDDAPFENLGIVMFLA